MPEDHDQAPPAPVPDDGAEAAAVVAERFRTLTVWLIVASAIVAILLAFQVRTRVETAGTFVFDCFTAALLSLSLLWWQRKGFRRASDAFGAVGLAGLGGMSCGAIAMLELRLHFPVADPALRAFDHAIGVDGLAIVEFLVRQGHWIFAIMAPAYNYTLPLFFAGIAILALVGQRVEAWRAAFCFVGTLFTTCLVAIVVPAKGLGVWASAELLGRLPPNAMRSFWPRFDEFYFGDDPVLRVQAVDGVISFPSFHAVVGFLVLAMWRSNIVTLAAAGAWLTFMLLATLPGGGHYLVDLIGGFVVWAGWFALSRRVERRAVPVGNEKLSTSPSR